MSARPADARDAVRAICAFLQERGYAIETPRLGAELHALKRGRGLGPFLPYVDYVFVHDLVGAADPRALERRHAEAIAHAETQFRLPRMLRYRIPNVVSVGVSIGAHSPETEAFVRASKLRSHLAGGGAKDSTYLVDLGACRLVTAGLERTPTKYGSIESSQNPTNRIFEMMVELASTLGLDVDHPRRG